MTITKKQILNMVKNLPDKIEVDELIYRLYLRQKLEIAEKDVQQGRIVPHAKVVKGTVPRDNRR
jgi:hypothetical protein